MQANRIKNLKKYEFLLKSKYTQKIYFNMYSNILSNDYKLRIKLVSIGGVLISSIVLIITILKIFNN